jgi:hypothetical protein
MDRGTIAERLLLRLETAADAIVADREQVVCNLLIVLERESMERLLAKVAGRRERGVHGEG